MPRGIAAEVTEGEVAPKLEKRTGDEKKRAEAKQIVESSRKIQVGTAVRLANLATQKASLRGKKKFEPRWSEIVFPSVFRVRQRNKRGGDTSNLSYAYKLEQTTGEPLEGSFKREELLVTPGMETEYLAGRSKAGLSKKLSAENTIPRMQEVNGKWKSILDGSSWAEKQGGRWEQQRDIAAQLPDRRRETAILLLGTVWVGRYCRSTIHLF